MADKSEELARLPPKLRFKSQQHTIPIDAADADDYGAIARHDVETATSAIPEGPDFKDEAIVTASKIRGFSMPRKPRVGSQYQASIPPLRKQ